MRKFNPVPVDDESWIDQSLTNKIEQATRPTKRDVRELLVAQEIAANPDFSLRAVARSISSSPQSVRRVARTLGDTVERLHRRNELNAKLRYEFVRPLWLDEKICGSGRAYLEMQGFDLLDPCKILMMKEEWEASVR